MECEVPPSRRSEDDIEARSRSRLVMIAGIVGLGALLGFALWQLGQTKWNPVLDMAITELRIRQVFSTSPPSIGLVGRIGSLAERGSHPGPLGFVLLAPFYRLYGSSGWAMEAAGATLNLIAMSLTLWLVKRNANAWAVAGVATGLVALLAYLGPVLAVTPWNPYLPIFWFVLVLAACWSALERDVLGLPLAVVAASVCAQTHISYAVLVTAPIALVLVVLVGSGVRRGDLRRVGWSIGLSAALVLVLWLPPVVQQFRAPVGNLGIIWRHFSDPPTPPIGFGVARTTILRHFDLVALVRRSDGLTGSEIPGWVLLGAWVASVIGAVRCRFRSLTRWNLCLGAALIGAVISTSRIFGPVHSYLVLWGWTLAVALAASVGAFVGLFVAGRVGPTRRSYVVRVGAVGLAVLVVGFAWSFVRQSVDAVPISHSRSVLLGDLTTETIGALRRVDPDQRGRYLVSWTDPVSHGSLGFGLLNELDRAGFRVGAAFGFQPFIGDERVLEGRGSGEIHVAVGPNIAYWDMVPGARLVAESDRRTAAQRARSDRLRAEISEGLAATGIDGAAERFDAEPLTLLADPTLPPELRETMVEYLDGSLPTAVYFVRS